MNGRTIAGLPVSYWMIGLVAGVVGFVWMRSKTKQPSGAAGGTAAQPTFTQAQEVQDFQIFSALTGAQQASDLNMLSTVAGMFAGGSSPTTTTPSTSPTSTGSLPPAVASAYEQGVANQLQFQSQPQSAQLQQLASSPNAPALRSLGQALASAPASQRGADENFLLLNQAAQQAGYDYYTAQGLQTTPLGAA